MAASRRDFCRKISLCFHIVAQMTFPYTYQNWDEYFYTMAERFLSLAVDTNISVKQLKSIGLAQVPRAEVHQSFSERNGVFSLSTNESRENPDRALILVFSALAHLFPVIINNK
jgi:hypothetical protein